MARLGIEMAAYRNGGIAAIMASSITAHLCINVIAASASRRRNGGGIALGENSSAA